MKVTQLPYIPHEDFDGLVTHIEDIAEESM
jgi:hypothetical protein